MNAIKLPVRAARSFGLCYVSDAEGQAFTIAIPSDVAIQISTALNSHDGLVAALEFYGRLPTQCRNRIDPEQPGNKNDWLADVSLDEGRIARDVLAKIESESVNEKPTKA